MIIKLLFCIEKDLDTLNYIMLTSERKVKKLFIKFLTWNKINKAISLIAKYPEIIMPWQKAFESTFGNNDFDTCIWILQKQSIYNFEINIHYDDDIVISKLSNLATMYRSSNGIKYQKYLETIMSLNILHSVNHVA